MNGTIATKENAEKLAAKYAAKYAADQLLILSASIAVEILRELGSPGCALLEVLSKLLQDERAKRGLP